MKLYQIDWYPLRRGDNEKESTLVLAETLRDADCIAKTIFDCVRVVAIYPYSSIAGGREGEEYWAKYVLYNGDILTYREYEKLKKAV